MPEQGIQQRLTGSTLKWVAIVTMFIDHLAYTLVWSLYQRDWIAAYMAGDSVLEGGEPVGSPWYTIYYMMRTVGRIAFPIFCFLLVEGFCHTHSRGKYALRLGAFCLLAEIPFDVAFNYPDNGFLEFSYQNVFFTLLMGFLALWLWSALANRLPRWMEYPAAAIALVPCYLGAEWLAADYGGFGVLLIVALGVGRGLPCRVIQEPDGPTAVWTQPDPFRRQLQVLLGGLAILWYCWFYDNWIELFAVFGLALTLLYNGQRGSGRKWFFYIFYPAHLLALGLLNQMWFH